MWVLQKRLPEPPWLPSGATIEPRGTVIEDFIVLEIAPQTHWHGDRYIS
jgi:hypothetical protein